MAGTPLIDLILDAMVTLIEGMTTAGGYNYDWGSADQPDEAKATFPMAWPEVEAEDNVDDPDGAHGQAYLNIVRVKLIARVRLSTEESVPVWAHKTAWTKALDDLKMLFGNNNSLSETAECIMYRRAQVIKEDSGDVFKPLRLETFWDIQYAQDRLTPTMVA